MTQHTPTLLKAENSPFEVYNMDAQAFGRKHICRGSIMICHMYDDDFADTIVRACNSHDQLLEALKDAETVLAEKSPNGSVLKKVRAVIGSVEKVQS